MKFLENKSWRWIPILAIVVGLVVAWPNQVRARPQLAITLLYFQGTGQNNAILLEWATATEFNTAGFVVDRADTELGPYSEQIGFIEAEGDGIIGAEYEALDDANVVNGQTYWYILVEIENGGTRNETDPIAVTGGLATPTPTRTPTSQPTIETQSSSTPTPSRTPTATGTVQPTTQTGPSPTPTRTPISSQATSPSGQPTQAGTATTAGNTQSTTGTGGGGVAEASSPNNPYPPPEGTASPTFVPGPGQADGTASEAYPAQETQAAQGESYPAGSDINPESQTTSPAIQPQTTADIRALNTQPPLNQQTPGDSESAEPGSSNTLFLWIGFTAAFLIFAGGVIGSIFLFARRSNQK